MRDADMLARVKITYVTLEIQEPVRCMHQNELDIVGLASVLHISSLRVSILVLMDMHVLVQ